MNLNDYARALMMRVISEDLRRENVWHQVARAYGQIGFACFWMSVPTFIADGI